GSSPVHLCSLVWISSTLRSAQYRADSVGASVFTNVLPAFHCPSCRLAGLLRHVHTSRVLGLLRDLRPIHRLQRTPHLSHHLNGFLTVGVTWNGSRVHWESIDQLGIQLCSGSLATSTPQFFLVASPPARLAGYGVDHHVHGGRALRPDPYPPALSRCHAYGAFSLIPTRIPSDLARRTHPVWQSRDVSALSALLPALPGVSRVGLRSAPTGILRHPSEEVLHLLQFPAPHGAPIMPSTDSGNRAARHSGSPWRNASSYMCE